MARKRKRAHFGHILVPAGIDHYLTASSQRQQAVTAHRRGRCPEARLAIAHAEAALRRGIDAYRLALPIRGRVPTVTRSGFKALVTLAERIDRDSDRISSTCGETRSRHRPPTLPVAVNQWRLHRQ
jgi:hypothetical protein